MSTRRQGTAATTREAIVAAAMQGFAEKGFEATSVREIAALAGSNVASISYHFGGKEGLRAACAAHIVEIMGAALAAARATDTPADPAEAERRLLGLVRDMTRFLLLRPEARLVAGFMLREMAHPSSALDTVYEGVFEGVHARACGLWGAAVGRPPETDAVRLAVFSVIGQILYFHIGRPVVGRRMAWTAIGPAEAEAVADTITANLSARLAADRSGL